MKCCKIGMLLVLGLGPVFAAGSYSFNSLSVLGHSSTLATGINNLGTIVGFYIDNSPNVPYHGFVLENGTYTTLDVPIFYSSLHLDVPKTLRMNWFFIAILVLVYGLLAFWMIRSARRWSPKAKTKRRLLVRDEDRLPTWRTVRARVLVGWVDNSGAITSGSWARSESSMSATDWAVLHTAKGKLVAYRFDDYRPDEPRTGLIEVCDSWRELELVVPPKIFQEALLEAGIKKTDEYRQTPLEL